MSNSIKDIPFVWPDHRRLASFQGSKLDIDNILNKAQVICGVVNGLSGVGVNRLNRILSKSFYPAQDNQGSLQFETGNVKIRLIVTLYPTCLTSSSVLSELLKLQSKYSALEVRLVTCDLLTNPESTIACYFNKKSAPVFMFGTSANLESPSDNPTHLTVALKPEPQLRAAWQQWFDLKWLKAVRLTEERTRIPALVLPEGTLEASLMWQKYNSTLFQTGTFEELIEISIDPITGQVTAKDADGKTIATVSAEADISGPSPIYLKLSKLLQMGNLVSVDKSTRLRPFEVAVNPGWFGLETLKQVGSVKRKVSYQISALKEDELKKLENLRKKISDLLDIFSFSLADGQRWMPVSAEELFCKERDRINKDGADLLSKIVEGNIDGFIEQRRKMVFDDANGMYHDLFPDKQLSDNVLDNILDTVKGRFLQTQNKDFLPKLSFSQVSLSYPEGSEWKSSFSSGFNLLLSIARYPRKACKNGIYFARGINAAQNEILKAMNILNDPFVKLMQSSDHWSLTQQAENELTDIEEIESLDITVEEKCQQIFQRLKLDVTQVFEDNNENADIEKAQTSIFDILEEGGWKN